MKKDINKILERMERLEDDDIRKAFDAVGMMILGILYLGLARVLPEWMVNMILVGAIVLSFCIYRIM